MNHQNAASDAVEDQVIDLCDSPVSTKRIVEHISNDDSIKTQQQKPLNKQQKTNSESSSCVVFLNSDDGNHNNDNGVVTEGLLQLLQDAVAARKKSSKTVVFCCRNVTALHVQQKDSWTCGFRNFQLLLSATLPLLFDKNHSFFRSTPYTEGYRCVPSLAELQAHMEQCWNSGYDPAGAVHFGRALVGKRAWIGAVEVSACLTYLGLDTAVVQFLKCPASRQLLGPFCAAYFSRRRTACPRETSSSSTTTPELARRLLRQASVPSSSSEDVTTLCNCPLLPLYLQWNGHSVTVVGVEQQRSDTNGHQQRPTHLLVLDPKKTGTTLQKALQQTTTADLRPFRVPLSRLHSQDTQLIVVSTRSLSVAEQESRKGPVRVVSAAEDAVLRAIAGSSSR